MEQPLAGIRGLLGADPGEKEGQAWGRTGVGQDGRLPGLWHQQAEQRSLFSASQPRCQGCGAVCLSETRPAPQQLGDLILLVLTE